MFSRVRLSTTSLVALISFFGQLYFFVPVMTPYLLAYDLSLAQVAGMQTVLLWAMLVMEVPTGVLADRLGHRVSYTIALVLAAAGEGIVLVANDYPEFLLAQLVAGTGFAFASGSVSAIVYESLPEDERPARMQRAWGRIGAATHAASLLAYSVGGWITADLTVQRMRITLMMGMVAVGIGAVLSLFLHVNRPVEASMRPASLGLLRAGWRSVRHNPSLQRLIGFSLLTNTFTAHLLVFYQQYFLDAEVPGAWFGLGLGLGSLVAIGAQFHAWRLVPWCGSNRALLIGAAIPAAIYLLMAGTRNPVLAIALFVAQWGAVHLAGPLFAGLFNKHVDDAARATSLSLINAITTIYVGIAGIALGWLSERSLPLTFVVIGSVALAGCLLMREPDRPSSGQV
jgi:MFS family permease